MTPQENDHPGRYTIRWFENGHIVLWLFKDLCWVSSFKMGGVIMMVPTLLLGIYITWLSKKSKSDLFHNLAVCFWIAANSMWMCSEFFELEPTGKPIATGLFVCGIIILLVYYIFVRKRA
ncbi:MAG: hypothetical protein SGJ10_01630 [Bacteroidota bacterium]|nr:hypothetical protein [Bacteroidota bacterium]